MLDNVPVTLHLVYSIALPILLYACEAIHLFKTQLISLEHPWSRCFMKILSTYDAVIVQQCQLYAGLLPIRDYYTIRGMKFLRKLNSTENCLLKLLYEMTGKFDIMSLAFRYGCVVEEDFKSCYDVMVRRKFLMV